MRAYPVPTLEMRNVWKTFPEREGAERRPARAWGGCHSPHGRERCRQVDLEVKILSGAYQPDPGAEILINGERVDIGDPIAAKRHGARRHHLSGLALAPNLTVAENIYLGDEIHHRGLVDRATPCTRCRPVWSASEPRSARGRPSASCRSPSSGATEIARALRQVQDSRSGRTHDRPFFARDPERLFALRTPRRCAQGHPLISASATAWRVYRLSDRVSVRSWDLHLCRHPCARRDHC